MQIEGELVASSAVESEFKVGERVFHDKFGYGAGNDSCGCLQATYSIGAPNIFAIEC